MRDRGNEERRCSQNGIEGSLKQSKHSSRIGRALGDQSRITLLSRSIACGQSPRDPKEANNLGILVSPVSSGPTGYIEKNSSDSGEMVN